MMGPSFPTGAAVEPSDDRRVERRAAAPGRGLAALDKKSGRVLWANGNMGAGYGSPVAFALGTVSAFSADNAKKDDAKKEAKKDDKKAADKK